MGVGSNHTRMNTLPEIEIPIKAANFFVAAPRAAPHKSFKKDCFQGGRRLLTFVLRVSICSSNLGQSKDLTAGGCLRQSILDVAEGQSPQEGDREGKNLAMLWAIWLHRNECVFK